MMFLAGHVILGLALRFVPTLAIAHAGLCVLVGLFIAATRRPLAVAMVVAYITGSEVLWRMSRAGVPYELGKYAVAAVLVIALLRTRAKRNRASALAYFALLVPGIALTLSALDLAEARQQISFNLSGPLSLALCVLFFSNLRVNAKEIRRIFFALIGPAVAIGTNIYFKTSAAKEIQFTGTSTGVTSGGFGPNQVSAILGLGLLFCVLMLFERKSSWRIRAPLLALSAFFAIQAALTFSRGGLLLAFIGAFGAIAYLVRDARTRVTLVLVATVFVGAAKFIVIPRLEVFTQGKIGERYSNVDSTGRSKLAGFDLQIFMYHPVLGVGPGVAPAIRAEMGHFGAAHTEYTRLLAEHGLLGALAGYIMLMVGVRTFRKSRGLEARAFVVAMLAWVFFFLGINAMRLAAPAFLFGLACAISFSSIPLPAKAAPRPRPP